MVTRDIAQLQLVGRTASRDRCKVRFGSMEYMLWRVSPRRAVAVCLRYRFPEFDVEVQDGCERLLDDMFGGPFPCAVQAP